MKSIPLLIIFLTVAMVTRAQSFSVVLERIQAMPASQKQQVLDEFVSSGVMIPVIETNSVVYFLYTGDADSVSIGGDATGWMPSLKMNKIGGTNGWFCKAEYEPDARLEYKVVINGSSWILDPLNRQVVNGGMGPNSELLMPLYQPPLFTAKNNAIPAGTVLDTVFQSRYLAEARPLKVYLPAGYDSNSTRYPVIIFHDGFELFERMFARNMLDNLIAEKRIQAPIAVFVQPVHRDQEYSGNLQKSYTLFITKELTGFLDQSFRTLPSPENRASIGISNGGNISLWLAASNPGVFGKVAAQSSNVERNVVGAFNNRPGGSVKVYLDFGKYDLPFLIPKIRALKKILEEKPCNFIYREYPEGHNWKFWQKHLPDALEYLFPVKE